ncbi:acetyl-CoA carboxylase biotin carboxyl carrier protein [Nonomuraea wenchangensis]|uniref:Biotin carboxyl carrier protein of acetyl-CoA carboxylase n=1 Tax=Nonomuraea wenchangensis TaxID=568860 RepID=A0A1I0AJR5_9ACTN|nr:biotin/lipoyl-containing protein [Nonomuraea wenchangensis]SES94547.1 acetyl-CoA carboxylase biotin carboxyl carrier protein [Nonomuraea wenchangensis]
MTETRVESADEQRAVELGSLEAEMTRLGAEGAMEILCRSLSGVVGLAPFPPARASARFGCASIEVEWASPEPAPAAPAAGAAAAVEEEEPEAEERHEVRAPLVGTFYRAQEPGAKPFVEVGDAVVAGQQVGIVEAMKLMNPVVAEVSGWVTDVVAGDGERVEFGQPLVFLRPGGQE